MKYILTVLTASLFLISNAQKNPLIGTWKFYKIDVKDFYLTTDNIDSVTTLINKQIFENSKNDSVNLTKEDSLAIYTKTENQIKEFTSYTLIISPKNFASINSSSINNGKPLNKKGTYVWIAAKNKILLTFVGYNGKKKTEIFYYNPTKNILFSTEKINGYKNYLEFHKN